MHQALKDYKIHPAAELFPLMSEDELRDLAADIKEHGQIHPVITHENAILDGRNRIIACHKAGVLVETQPWEPNGSPTAWVISVNLKRRQLTASQRAAVATESLKLFEEEAKARQTATLKKGNVIPDREIIPSREEKGKASEKAAAAVGVNHRYVSDAKAIKEKSPETFSKVLSGEMSIPEAKKTIFKKDRTESEFKSTPPKDKSTGDSPELLQLKVWWNRASKKDQKAFLKYIKI
jgi:hypothetical protein